MELNEELFGLDKKSRQYNKLIRDIGELIFDNPDSVQASDSNKDLPYLIKNIVTFKHDLDGKTLEIEHDCTNINKFKITLDGEPIELKTGDKCDLGDSLKRLRSDDQKQRAKERIKTLKSAREKENAWLGVSERFKHLKTFEQFTF